MQGQQAERSTQFRRIFRHTKAKGRRLSMPCATGGDGDPLLLLHGFSQSRYMWAERDASPADNGR